MLEDLFGIQPAASKKDAVKKLAVQKKETVAILDARKGHNFAIQLRALGLSRREVCEALLEGKVHADILSVPQG